MDVNETKTVLRVLKMNYVNQFKKINKEEMEWMLKLWTICFNDNSKEEVMIAILNYIENDRYGYIPSIGQIKGIIDKTKFYDDMTEGEAWELVVKACRNAGTAKVKFDEWPMPLRKAVGSVEVIYSLSESKKALNDYRKDFRQAYKEALEQEKARKQYVDKMRTLTASESLKIAENGVNYNEE